MRSSIAKFFSSKKQSGITRIVAILIAVSILAVIAVAVLILNSGSETPTMRGRHEPTQGGTFIVGTAALSFGAGETLDVLDIHISQGGRSTTLVSGISVADLTWRFLPTSDPNIATLIGYNEHGQSLETYYINVMTSQVLYLSEAKGMANKYPLNLPPSYQVIGVSSNFNEVYAASEDPDEKTITISTNNGNTVPNPPPDEEEIVTLPLLPSPPAATQNSTSTPPAPSAAAAPPLPDISPQPTGTEPNPPDQPALPPLSWVTYTSDTFGFQFQHPEGWLFDDVIPLNTVVSTKQLVLLVPNTIETLGARISFTVHQVSEPFPYNEYAQAFFAPSPYEILPVTVNGLSATLIDYFELGGTRIIIASQGNTYVAALLVPGNLLTLDVYNTILNSFEFTSQN